MSEEDQDVGRLGRRSVLKAGVAAGVATAAWAAPSIRSASVVALDASACTVPIIEYTSDDINTNQSSNCGPNNEFIVYGSSGTSAASINIKDGNTTIGTLTINADNQTSLARGDEGRCSESPGPTYSVSLTTPGLTCGVAYIELYFPGNSGNGAPPVRIPSGSTNLPEIDDTPDNSSRRIRAGIECCPTANYHP